MKEEMNLDREVLFFKYCNNSATPSEKAWVDQCIAETPAYAEELDAVRHALAVRQNIQELESYDAQVAYRKISKIIGKSSRKQRFMHTLSRIAAIMTLPLLISTLTFGYILYDRVNNETMSFTEVVAAPGTISRFELPDKSRVWLNSNSRLRYPNRFNSKAREVELEGEGYFEVESDPKYPFFVATASDVKVKAYGTAFNVNTKKNKTEAILASGRVAMYHKDRIVGQLTPGEQASFDPTTEKAEMSEVSLLEKLAWKDGRIIFRNAPLDEVLEQLSQRYNMDIILHDEHQQSGQYLSRVTFTDETLQQIFSYLEIAAPIRWELSSIRMNNDSTLVKQQIDVWLEKRK